MLSNLPDGMPSFPGPALLFRFAVYLQLRHVFPHALVHTSDLASVNTRRHSAFRIGSNNTALAPLADSAIDWKPNHSDSHPSARTQLTVSVYSALTSSTIRWGRPTLRNSCQRAVRSTLSKAAFKFTYATHSGWLNSLHCW